MASPVFNTPAAAASPSALIDLTEESAPLLESSEVRNNVGYVF